MVLPPSFAFDPAGRRQRTDRRPAARARDDDDVPFDILDHTAYCSCLASSAADGAPEAFGGGWVQREGGPVEVIRPGDVVCFEPGEKHWHGATATTAMTHIAIQEALDGKAVDWMEQVSEDQYRTGPRTT
jgi:hypothetical protein